MARQPGITTSTVGEAQLDLIDGIYAASTDPARWAAFMDRVTHWFCGEAAMFVRPRHDPDATRFLGGNIDADLMRQHDEYYIRCNPWIPHVGTTHPIVDMGERMVPLDEFVRTEFYNDWIKQQGILHWVGIRPQLGDDSLLGLGIGRSAAFGSYSAEEEALLAILSGHIARAAEISRRLDLLDLQATAASSVLDNLRAGVLLVGADRRIAYANRSAERLLRAGDGLCVVDGRLRATGKEVQGRLGAAIAAATMAQDGVRQGGATLSAPRTKAAGPLSLFVTPLDERDRPALGAGLLAMVLIAAPEQEHDLNEEGMRAVYDFTPAEARLAAALCAGQSLADHAGAAGISLNTVKYHLKSVFGKTGDARQPELVRRLLSDPVLRMTG